MNHAKKTVGLALATLLLTACAPHSTTHRTPAATQTDYAQAVADAKKSLASSKKAHFEWRDTGKILKKAAKAAKKGDFDSATKLAKKAQRQGQLALLQAKAQANAGPH